MYMRLQFKRQISIKIEECEFFLYTIPINKLDPIFQQTNNNQRAH